MKVNLEETLEEAFQGMIKAAYNGQELGDNQYNGLKQAFMGGALITLNQCVAGGTLAQMTLQLEIETFTYHMIEFAKAGGKGRL